MSKKEIVGINLLKREAKKPPVKKTIGMKPSLKRPFEFNRDTALMVVIFLVFCLAFGGYYYKLVSTINSKEKLLLAKKAELKRLEKVYARLRMLEARKKELLRMIEVIDNLSRGRDRMVRFFEGLESDIPNESWLSALTFKGNAVRMEGYALDDNGVADFIENISREASVARCSLKYIKEVTISGMKVREFSLTTYFR